MQGSWQVGVDVGGTFTDVVAIRPSDGQVRTAKVFTRSQDRVAGLKEAFAAVELDWSDAQDVVHGTTMVTNAIVEDKLAEVALVTTAGFADTLAIGRQNRRHLYRLDLPPKASPQVREENRFEVTERLDPEGQVLEPLDPHSVGDVVARLGECGTDAVAVSLLHSYADPRHEEEIGARLRERFPYVALSNRVNPEAREYERTATTVLSASVMPLAAGYLDRLEAVRPAGSRLHMFHSAGGMASPDALRELPLGLALSGPAAGVAAACAIARELQITHAISFDMGGTTTDACLIVDGQAQIAADRVLGERSLRQPMVAVESIGAGGGSIARLDHGALCVGPESAGAEPGPACYARGGISPTVTDANLVLGYMDSARTIGGSLALSVSAARRALEPLAKAMRMTVEEAALGVVRVVNSAMVRALRRVTVERGVDGRLCALLAFGGAGPMHAVDVARAFGIRKIIVPNLSSAFSAFGCVSAQMSYSQQRTVRMSVGEWDTRRLAAIRQSSLARLVAPLESAGHTHADISVEEFAAIRYRGQSYAIEVREPTFDDPIRLGQAFFEQHQKLYGFVSDDPWELVAIRQRASAPRRGADFGALTETPTESSAARSAPCTFQETGPIETPRIWRTALYAGRVVRGPLVIEDEWSTVVVPPGASLTRDRSGHLHIDTGAVA